jgi:neutral ceramidase
MIHTGHAKVEIKAFRKGIGMLGYGRYFNTMEGVLSPIYCRAVTFWDSESNRKLFYVNAELCFITHGVKREVIKRLKEKDPQGGYEDENMLLSAQHTHSGPGGYAYHPFYNFPVPGFRPYIFNAIVEAFVEAIYQSNQNLSPSKLYFHSGEFEPDIDVAFNRSLKAYNQNPEVIKRSKSETHLALERKMDLLRIDDLHGSPKAQINWFGVHTTSLGNRVNLLSGDNKGFASQFFEEDLGGNFHAIFAQQIAGDVSPNLHGKRKNGWKKKGPHQSDIDNAKFNGRLQYYKAKEIWEASPDKEIIQDTIDYILAYVDMSNVKVDPYFANGRTDAETDSACHGTAFFSGTPVDGPGMPQGVKQFAEFCSNVIKYGEYFLSLFRDEKYRNWVRKKYKVQGRKHIVFETGRGVAFGTRNMKMFFIPGFFDAGIAEMKRQHRRGALRELPWTPHIVPLQIVRIGQLALAAFPGEISTVGGQRLRNMLLKELEPIGIKHVIISSYSNNYMGYCVTYEEYQVQCYEGGHTVFGQWTHAAFMTKFRELAREMLKPIEHRIIDRSVQPHTFSEKEMALRTYYD